MCKKMITFASDSDRISRNPYRIENKSVYICIDTHGVVCFMHWQETR